MMNRKTLLQLLLLVTLSMSVASCSQTRLSKLDGQWQLFWINDLTDPNIYIWDFNAGELTVTMYEPPTPVNPNPQPHVGGRATYKTKAEFLDAVIEISGYEPSVSAAEVNRQLHDGKWTIAKIDADVMRLATTPDYGGYEIREFTRVK